MVNLPLVLLIHFYRFQHWNGSRDEVAVYKLRGTLLSKARELKGRIHLWVYYGLWHLLLWQCGSCVLCIYEVYWGRLVSASVSAPIRNV